MCSYFCVRATTIYIYALYKQSKHNPSAHKNEMNDVRWFGKMASDQLIFYNVYIRA